MLSKVSDNTYNVIKNLYHSTGEYLSGYTNIDNFKAPAKTLYIHLWSNKGISTAYSYRVFINNDNSDNMINDDNGNQIYAGTDRYEYTYTKTLSTAETLYLKGFISSQNRTAPYECQITYLDAIISKKINTRKSKPRQLKDIGNKVSCTLFGYHIDGKTRYTGE